MSRSVTPCSGVADHHAEPGAGSNTDRVCAEKPLTTKAVHNRVLLPVYVPALLLGISSQAVLILLPLYVLELGGSAAAAASTIGFCGMGMMTIDIPAGVMAARFGERFVMLLAMVLIGGAYFGFAAVNDVSLLHFIAFLYGAGSSSFLLGRMSYITAVCPPAQRGRVIAVIAGSLRVSALVGPLGGAAIAKLAGFELAFLTAGAWVLAAFICVAVFADDDHHVANELDIRAVADLAFDYRRVFATAGVAAITFMLMRAARTVLIPLTGAQLGLDVASIGLVVSVAAVVDVAMFYPAGLIMDRHGRRATAVPSSILFAVSLATISLVQGFYSLMAAAVLAGFANGLSTGIVMTLGTDLAPENRRGEFLGLWRLLTDFGTAAGPMVVACAVAVAPIGIAAVSVAAVGAMGGFVVYRYVEETLRA